jgi:hypothetical protein
MHEVTMISVKANAVLLTLVLVLLLVAGAEAGAGVEKKLSRAEISPDMVTTSDVKPGGISVNMNALRRIDFVIKGTSCPACLLKVQKRLEKTQGVAQAGIMLNKPYGGVCIYDGSKIDKSKLLLVAAGDEKLVTFDQVEDASIAKMPLILVPHHAFEK